MRTLFYERRELKDITQLYRKVGFGRANIDNNPIEGTFRPTKDGLRNSLFIGHPAAGWRSAVVYGVVATCKLFGVNPEGYIARVLPKVATATNKTASGLLPHDYAVLPQKGSVGTAYSVGQPVIGRTKPVAA